MADDGEAEEVETDDELKAMGAPSNWAIDGAEEVDTDDGIKQQASKGPPESVFCLWGEYHPARLQAVQQGMYHVLFGDGSSRWASAGELMNAETPLPRGWAQPGSAVLFPIAYGAESVYVQGTLVKRTQAAAPDEAPGSKQPSAERWEVRRDGGAGSTSEHSVSVLRLPLAHGGALGHGVRLAPSSKVHALRGQWRPGTLVSTSRTRGVQVSMQTDPSVSNMSQVWVSGGQLVSTKTAADRSQLAPGSRAVAHTPRAPTKMVEVAVLSMGYDEDSVCLCVDDVGNEVKVEASALRQRYEVCYRVLAPAGGFQRATVVEVTPDGMYAVKLAGGSKRWVSACELVTLDAKPVDPRKLSGGIVVAVLPQSGVADARWLSAATVGGLKPGQKSPRGMVPLRRPRTQKPLSVRVERRDGRYGLSLDDDNRIVSLADGCAAIDAGIKPGDRILCVNGKTIHDGDALANALAGTDYVDMGVATDRDGGMGGGDADGDGVLDDGEEGAVWNVEASRLRLPLLTASRDVAPSDPITLGDEVFAMVGGWREACVEKQEEGRYLLHHGRGERRWADGGEVAWHDIAPMAYDVSEDKPLLGWQEQDSGFQSIEVLRQAGNGFKVRYDNHYETKLEIPLLRERWTLPLRALAFYGDYKPAAVLESMGGLMRIDFGDGDLRWALPDEVLCQAEARMEMGEEILEGSHVGAKVDGSDVFRRATLVRQDGAGFEVLTEDGASHSVASDALRRLRLQSDPPLKEKDEVLALDGAWVPSIITGIADDSGSGGRLPAAVFHQGKRLATTLSSSELVSFDVGDHHKELAALKPGAPVIFRPDAAQKETWLTALIKKPPTTAGAAITVLMPNGSEKSATPSDVRPRRGKSHPAEYAAALAEARMLRFTSFMVIRVQCRFRAFLSRRREERLRQQILAATLIQALLRGAAVRRENRRRAKAAEMIQRAWRGCLGRRRFREAVQNAVAAEAEAEEQRRRTAAATRIQKHARGFAQRRRYSQMRQAAQATQRAWRGVLGRRRLREAVQNAVAAEAEAERQRRRTAAATRIQKHARGYICRKTGDMYAQFRRVILVQSCWRRHVALSAYHRQRAAIIAIQAHGRGLLARRERDRRRVTRDNLSAAITMQSCGRGLLGRLERNRRRVVRDHIQFAITQVEAAITLQAYGRRMLAVRVKWMRRVTRDRLAAAIVIEACGRGLVARLDRNRRRVVRDHIQFAITQVIAATTLQAYGRRMLAVRDKRRRRIVRDHIQWVITQLEALTKIQAYGRRMLAVRDKRRLRVERDAATLIQASGRRRLAVNLLRAALHAATRIQAYARSRALRKFRSAGIRAVVVMQSGWRRVVGVALLRRAQQAATTIQAAARGRAAILRYMRAIEACTHIQAAARRRAARHVRRVALGAATLIATRARGRLARKDLAYRIRWKKAVKEVNEAVVYMQKCGRRVNARAHLVWLRGTFHSTKIQRIQRGRAVRKPTIDGRPVWMQRGRAMLDGYVEVYWPVDQQYHRCFFMDRRVLTWFMRARTAAIRIQARARMLQARAILRSSVTVTVRSQAESRRCIAMMAYAEARLAIVCIQAHARSRPPRMYRKIAIPAAAVIQARARVMIARNERVRLTRLNQSSAVTLQRLERGRAGRARVAALRAAASAARLAQEAEAERRREQEAARRQALADQLKVEVRPKTPPVPLPQPLPVMAIPPPLPPPKVQLPPLPLPQPLRPPPPRTIDPLEVYRTQAKLGTRRRPPPKALPALDLAGLEPKATLALLQANVGAADVKSKSIDARYHLGGDAPNAVLAELLLSRPYKGAAVERINALGRSTLSKKMDHGALNAMQDMLDALALRGKLPPL